MRPIAHAAVILLSTVVNKFDASRIMLLLDGGVDFSTVEIMTKAVKAPRANRQIVGFSLSREQARKVKAEAAKRGVSLRKLFEELWELYEQKQAPDGRVHD